MKIEVIETSRTQLGWVATCHFRVTTAKQFTDEQHYATESSRWLIWSLAKAYFAARRLASSLKAKPGEREAFGWN